MIQINLWWFLAVLLIMGFVAYILGHCAGREESRERAEVLRTVQMLANKNLLRLNEDGRLAVDVEDVEKLRDAIKEEKKNDAE
uniref:Uncharacterized protein n=1 Tax=Caudovirales sp. ctrNG92 TaxID=2827638 RepID=A0A8S5SE22_9CAUD|nr:MAG TPA: hypothetical protein [Caudovirales sp. ctrNG92]